MAISPQFLSVKGFNGVSCQPNAPISKASLSFNVDTSRGTIKPRQGFVTVKRFYPSVTSGSPTKAIAVRVLGIKSFTTRQGTGLIMVFLWDENTNKILFAVIDHQGQVIDSSMPYSVSDFPHAVRPGPYMFPVFAETGTDIFISFPSGEVFTYNYEKNPYEIESATVGDLGFKPQSFPYFNEVPAARIVYSWAGQIIYAGFDGDESTAFSQPPPEDQSEIPADQMAPNRGSVNLAKGMIYFSDIDDSTAVAGRRFTSIGVGQDITAILGQGNTLYAFTNQSIFAGMYSQPDIQVLSMQKMADGVGCVSQRCIVQGGGLTLFLSSGGVYSLNGQSVEKISSDLDDMFAEEGWNPAPMYKMSQNDMLELPYPFKILQSQLKFSCGGYDPVRNLFFWSVPVAGTHFDEVYTNQYQSGSVDEMVARVCIVFSPDQRSWSIWGSTDGSSFIPTCFESAYEGSKTRFLFGDEFSGVNAYGEDSVDRASSSSGGRNTEPGVEFRWLWQSQPLPIGEAVAGSARSLRVKQLARGGNLSASSKTDWHLETEFSFDQTDGELSFTNTMSPNPSELYPKSATPTHIWESGSTWGTVKWHKKSTWKARYSVDNNIVGRTFQVGFSGTANSQRSLNENIYDFDLEIQPKRDIT